MSETYENWVDRVMGGREGKPLTEGEVVIPSQPEPFRPMDFLKTVRLKYTGEVGKKGDAYIYHFYPALSEDPDDFYLMMAGAFSEVFKDTDRIEADWVHDLKSWAVRANGFTSQLYGDEMALSVFDVLDKLLAKRDE